MICGICKTEMKQVGGPEIEEVLFNQEPHRPIEEECPNCGREYKIKLYPRIVVHQRQYGTA